MKSNKIQKNDKNNLPKIFSKIKKCKSKKNLKTLIENLPKNWKILICIYLKDYFVFDLYTRKLSDKITVLSKRTIFHKIIHHPELLDKNCHMNNNTMKNFCVGMVNFITKNYDKIKIKDYQHLND